MNLLRPTRAVLFLIVCSAAFTQTAPELVVTSGHSGAIRQLAFTPDNRTLLSSGDDGYLRFWDAERATFLRKIAAHSGSVNDMAVCPDGSIVASAGADAILRLWRVDTGRMIVQTRVDGSSHLAWLGDCRRIAVSGGTAVAILDIENLSASPKLLQLDEFIATLQYLPAKRRLVAGTGYSNSLRAWNSATWEALPRHATKAEDRPDFLISSLGGSRLASYTYGSLTIVDPESLDPLGRLPGAPQINAASLSPDGSSLLIAETAKTTIWSLAFEKKFEIAAGGVAAAWNASGTRIALGDVYGGIQVFDAAPASAKRFEIAGGGVAIGSAQFVDSGTLRVFGAIGNAGRIWDIGPIENEQTLPGAMLPVVSSAAAPNGSFLTVFSAQELTWWDLDPVPVPHSVHTKSIKGWPLTCLPDGRCAWQESDQHGNWIAVADVRRGLAPKQFALQSESAVALAFSPDGSRLAAATNQPHVRIWSIADGAEHAPLALESPFTEPDSGGYLRQIETRHMILVHPAMATALEFSSDGKLLAAANVSAVHLWDVPSFTLRTKIPTHSAVPAIAFGPGGKLAYSLESGEVHVSSLTGGTPEMRLNAGPSPQERLVFRSDGAGLASADPSAIVLWNLSSRSMLAKIEFTARGSWVASAPDGAFDASGRAWEQASWHMNESMRSLVPLETYARDYYAPGLVGDLLSGRERPARRSFAQLNRNLPVVRMSLLEQHVPGSETIHVRIQVAANGARSASDLHIYRNGRLTRTVDGTIATAGKDFTRDFEIRLAAGNNQIGAAAFNEDGLRSGMVQLMLPATRSMYQALPSTIHVLAIGINEYADKAFRLRFAVPDAEAIASALNFSWEEMRKSGQNAQPNIRLSGPPSTFAYKAAVRLLKDSDATRDGILAALRQVGAQAGPSDTVVIFYAGHSTAEGDHFYLLPHDMQFGNPASYVSDTDLENAMASLDAAHIAIIFDSCNSGKILDARERRGPLNARGMARLTYEKAMFVLTASQTSEEAMEETGLKHGLLTYALVDEGIGKWKADPGNTGEIELGAWLRYGAKRVPVLSRETRELQQSRGVTAPNRKPGPRQTPQFVADPLPAREEVVLRIKTATGQQ